MGALDSLRARTGEDYSFRLVTIAFDHTMAIFIALVRVCQYILIGFRLQANLKHAPRGIAYHLVQCPEGILLGNQRVDV